jgi:hypothetical protein
MKACIKYWCGQLLRNGILDPQPADGSSVMHNTDSANRFTRPCNVQTKTVIRRRVRNWDDTVSEIDMPIESEHQPSPVWVR